MRTVNGLGLLAAGILACACGGAGYGGAPKSAQSSASGPAPAAEPGGAALDSTGGATEEKAAEAGERPGLGTEWGENRESHVSTSAFFRENPDRPFDVVKMFYNDREGARAMARRAGISDFGSGLVHAQRDVVTVRLLDGNGRQLEGFNASGNNYVVGEAGQRYIIEIHNNTNVRFEAVTTVDGLDVINGRNGSFSSRGYILGPRATVEIDGWRRSTDTVAAFRFGRVSDSYAGKKGEDRNVGVIGVALFEERGASFPWTQREIDRRHEADPFPSRFAAPPSNDF
jgi:hypothetical protein